MQSSEATHQIFSSFRTERDGSLPVIRRAERTALFNNLP